MTVFQRYTVDQNGHLVNHKGELIFDPGCYGCDAPNPQLPKKS